MSRPFGACRFWLSQDFAEITVTNRTEVFKIVAGDGSSTHWTDSNDPAQVSQIQSSPNPSHTGSLTSSASIRSTLTNQPTTPTATQASGVPFARLALNLSSDASEHSYQSGGVDCLTDGEELSPGCWDVLGLDAWLANWYLHIPQCQGPNVIHCNGPARSGHGQEPWTTTFLREAEEGGGSDCTVMGVGSCSYSPANPLLGEYDSLLTRARYKYVRYSIYSRSFLIPKWWSKYKKCLIDDARNFGVFQFMARGSQ